MHILLYEKTLLGSSRRAGGGRSFSTSSPPFHGGIFESPPFPCPTPSLPPPMVEFLISLLSSWEGKGWKGRRGWHRGSIDAMSVN